MCVPDHPEGKGLGGGNGEPPKEVGGAIGTQ